MGWLIQQTWLATNGDGIQTFKYTALPPQGDLISSYIPNTDGDGDVFLGSAACVSNWVGTTALCARTGSYARQTSSPELKQYFVYEMQLITGDSLEAAFVKAKLGVKDTTATTLCGIKEEAETNGFMAGRADTVTPNDLCESADIYNLINLYTDNTRLDTEMWYRYGAATPNEAAVEDLFYGKTIKTSVKYLNEAAVDEDYTFPARPAPTPAPDAPAAPAGATGVTTMGSVLAAVTLFALAAW